MTLRVTVEIVPHGNEAEKKQIGILDISNIGTIDEKDYPHVICKYRVVERVPRQDKGKEISITHPDTEHDRFEGFWVLIRKAIEGFENTNY